MKTKFEYRTKNSSSPLIQRLDYEDVYIYLIEGYTGDCSYLGCDCQRMTNRKIKVRYKSNEKIKQTKEGRNSLKIPFDMDIDENIVIELYKSKY